MCGAAQHDTAVHTDTEPGELLPMSLTLNHSHRPKRTHGADAACSHLNEMSSCAFCDSLSIHMRCT